ncbi:MAG TPA: SAM-dependent methyltransferase [Candidatus Acidoferrum sp.]
MNAPIMRGKIYLMGAGTGDPHLLTTEAVRLLREAEVVLHDEQVSPEILDLVPASAQVRNLDKLCEHAGFSQEKTNALLIDSAREGRLVVRLKSGGHFVAEQVAEEMVALAQADVDFEVIPGVRTAMAVAVGQNSSG